MRVGQRITCKPVTFGIADAGRYLPGTVVHVDPKGYWYRVQFDCGLVESFLMNPGSENYGKKTGPPAKYAR